MRLFLLTFILLINLSGTMSAQDITFKAKAKQAVVEGDKFQLVYTLNKEGNDIRLAPLQDFQILMGPSTSYSHSTSIVNGKVSRETSYTFTFILKALKVGNYTIPSATIMVDGEKHTSNQLQIQVVKAEQAQTNSGNQSAPSSAATADELFITVTPSKRTLYQNESMLLTTKIYTKVQLDGLSDIKQPKLTAFIAQDLKSTDGINWSMENINGRTYNVGTYEQKLLFPQKTGKITIEPTEIEFLVRQRTAARSRSIFDDFFESGYRSVKKTVKSKPITLSVKPLPNGRPQGFTGGVGQLNMSASVTKNQVKVNDGITLKVTINGTGNHKFVENPQIKFPADFDDFDPKIANNTTNTVAGMKGSKTFEYLMIPRHAGEFTIPSIKFSYFNPKTGSYQSQESGPITVMVEKGEGDEITNSGVVRSNVSRENIKFIGKDIRFIKTITKLKPQGTFLFGSMSYYLAFIVPLLIFIFLFIINQKRIKENANVSLQKTKRANKAARQRLKRSAQLLKAGEKEAFYEEVLKALYGYMSDKLSIPLSELTKENASDILIKSKASQQAVDAILEIVDTCEFARYAPVSGTGEMDKLYQKTISTISQLENQIKRK